MKNYVLTLVAISLIIGCSGEKGHQYGSKFQQGVDLLNEFKFENARTAFQDLAESQPGSPVGLYGHALTEEGQLKYLDALHLYMSINEVDSVLPESFEGACRVMLRMGMIDDAFIESALFLRKFPDDPRSHYWLAKVSLDGGTYARARTECDRMIEHGGDKGVASLIKARAHFLEGSFDSAAVYLEKGLASVNKSPQHLMAAADYYETADMTDSATYYSREFVTASEDRPDANLEHFHRLLRLGQFSEARSLIYRLEEKGAGEIVVAGLWLFYYRGEETPVKARNAGTIYRTLVRDCMSSSFYEFLVRGVMDEGVPVEEEVMWMENIMAKEGYNARFQALLKHQIVIYMSTLKFELRTLADLGNVRGEFRNRMDTKLSEAHLLYRTGQWDEGDRKTDILVSAHKKQPIWESHLGDLFALHDVKLYDKAVRAYEAALETDQWYRPAFVNYVEMYLRIDQPDKALALFEKYPHFETKFESILALKGLVQVRAALEEEGVETIGEQLSKIHNDFRISARAYQALDESGNLVTMKKLAQLLQAASPNNPDAQLLAWDIYFDCYDSSAALEAAEKAVTLEPQSVSAAAKRAFSYHLTGETDRGRTELENLIAENREEPDVNLYLSWLLADQGVDLQRASNLARKSNFNSFMQYRNWMNLCYVYVKYGRSDLARGEASKSSRKFKDRPLPFYWLGVATHLENKDGAAENLVKAIDLGLRGNELKEANKILVSLR
ncbi:MAG: tetratricopeptide repeat protein [bacterium]|nr:tetratricopeptide repeat protein [bacterium]